MIISSGVVYDNQVFLTVLYLMRIINIIKYNKRHFFHFKLFKKSVMINNNRNLNKLLSPFILFFIKSILQQLFFKSLIFVLLHLQKSELTLLLFTNELPIHIIESPFIVDLLHNVVTVRRRGLKMNF